MKVKDKIKKSLDKLGVQELGVLSAMIDQMLADNAPKSTNPGRQDNPYLKVREILQQTSLTSADIIEDREERI